MKNLPKKHLAALRIAHPTIQVTETSIVIDDVDVTHLAGLATDRGAEEAELSRGPLTAHELVTFVSERVAAERDGVDTLCFVEADGRVVTSKRTRARA